jgi:hypothetical protein
MAITMPVLTFVLFLFIILQSAFSVADYTVISPLTVGVDSATGARPYRKNINNLTGMEVALYLQALQEMQQADQSEKLSWFQFAGKDMKALARSQPILTINQSGIHGYPATTWDGSTPYPGNRYYPGYAYHNCELFLPWVFFKLFVEE